MTELSTTTPSEIKQMSNFFTGGKEIVQSMGKRPSAQKILLAGLITVAPEEVRTSGILENPSRQNVVSKVIKYQIKLNDRLDFQGTGRPSFEKYSQQVEGVEAEAYKDYHAALQHLPDTERVFVEQAMNNSIREVEFVEKWIREKRDAKTMLFPDVKRYRELVNAISTVADIAIILGPGSLEDRLHPLPSELDIQTIADKYAWVMGNNPAKDTERAVMITYNMAMDGQVSDDWHDRKIDELMRVPSFGTAALRMSADDVRLAKSYLWFDIKKGYRRKAKELGLGRIPAKGMSVFVNNAEKAKRIYTEIAKKRGTEPSRLSMREKEYAAGNLDFDE